MPLARTQSWSHINMELESEKDSLLSCLVLLTRYYQNPFTAKSLIARLPVKKGQLTVDLFERAAARASLETEIIRCKFKKIEKEDLPAVLLMKNHEACLLVTDDEGKRKVIHPHNPKMFTDPDEIIDQYSGEIIVVKPQYKQSARAKETLHRKHKNWFWKVVFKSWSIYSEVLVASLLINLFALVIPLFIMNVYDRVVPNYAIETMWVLASGVGLVFIFDMLLKTLRAYFIDVASKHSDRELSAKIFQQILGLRMDERPKSVGALANTVQSFELFRDFITSGTMTILVDLPFVVIFLLVIYLIGGSLFWIPMLVVPTIFLIGFLLQLPLIRLTRKSYQLSAEKQATLIESLSAIEAVKTTGAESKLQNRWEEIIKLASENGMRLRFISNSSLNITTLAQQVATIFVVIAGVYMISEGELTTGGLIACTILTGRALAPMAQVASLFTRYYQSVNALKSLDKIMQLNTDIDEEDHYLHRPAIQGELEFKNVSFSYYSEKISALNNVSFKVKSGEKIAIIGRVGSGKSTIARLIVKLYEPTEGVIYMDGTDYRQLNPDDLRQQIGYVSQDVTLFYGTIKENISVGAPFIEDKSLLKAAEIAGVTEFTKHHPQGFDRQVGEKGNELSGGQRQAIAMARALLLKPNLLVLDEPTAFMDDNSERRLKKHLKEQLSANGTLVLITHKMSMLELVERIIVVDYGRIVADGSKESVLNALKSGVAVKKV
ncbi:toxin secretion ATP binding protein [Legionella israelensis]|uniref:Toxin secretion ATP binding protein n=2 Tax=Legionella israelensis TaxID=454 RepID=A0A0W0VH22_9GAMM|nr:type I secretion system permease/ATPase [Legionella israelensis]KTD19407.1 toxin secretion ATP binding protein [Legionella israelensis]QBS08622.1 type I secretion system permease/ATPase [Legionella israelensis]SCY09526.1 ATP-binding cassette, subfamily C, LapB [Legionella israelensis DSM 19235]STX58284.1 toxin secretion ATP binding protein [Legionella israelensis]